MKLAVTLFSGLVTLTCGGALAHAQELVTNPVGSVIESQDWDQNFTFSDGVNLDPSSSNFLVERSKRIQFGSLGRWKMNVETVTRSEESPLPREEMRAGATYNFTPRFSLGGSVSVGAEELDDVSQWKEQNVEAGVKLRTTFKF